MNLRNNKHSFYFIQCFLLLFCMTQINCQSLKELNLPKNILGQRELYNNIDRNNPVRERRNSNDVLANEKHINTAPITAPAINIIKIDNSYLLPKKTCPKLNTPLNVFPHRNVEQDTTPGQ